MIPSMSANILKMVNKENENEISFKDSNFNRGFVKPKISESNSTKESDNFSKKIKFI